MYKIKFIFGIQISEKIKGIWQKKQKSEVELEVNRNIEYQKMLSAVLISLICYQSVSVADMMRFDKIARNEETPQLMKQMNYPQDLNNFIKDAGPNVFAGITASQSPFLYLFRALSPGDIENVRNASKVFQNYEGIARRMIFGETLNRIFAVFTPIMATIMEFDGTFCLFPISLKTYQIFRILELIGLVL